MQLSADEQGENWKLDGLRFLLLGETELAEQRGLTKTLKV